MSIDAAKTARGAIAGAVAALVWAAQQPLDERAFGVPYDDTELLGAAVTDGRAVLPVGWLLHTLNGAAFGAGYANLAPRLPLPSWARGPAVALVESTATWPGTAFIPRLHPRAARFPKLWGSRNAFLQATWRHLLFGVVMGELERRLNAPEVEEVPPSYEHVVSTNGHGSIDHAMVTITPVVNGGGTADETDE
ncbi:MAG: hypothetical protein JWM31_1930 [Solirubrobacterales bacterium]|nr:hypothetical protein [Solirubrobacterales bacterium]